MFELAHFLHGCEQRIASHFTVHVVKHLFDGIDDAKVR